MSSLLDSGPEMPLELTPAEAAQGFALATVRMFWRGENISVRGVARPLGGGLFAVKVRGEGGAIVYEIRDGAGRALYLAARSLAELTRRFP